MDVERPAHADAVGHHVGVLEGEVDAMVATEATARHAQLPGLVFPANEGQKLVQDIALVLKVTKYAHARMDAFVVPALGVDSIKAEDLQFPAFDFRGQNADHAAVFVLEKLTHGGWKDDNWRPCMTEDKGLHVAMQFLAVGFVIFAIHRGGVTETCRDAPGCGSSQPEYLTRSMVGNALDKEGQEQTIP